jgi:glycosyltransferase involved in cell wall biosynthesis
MTNEPLISVVVTAYNEEEYLPKCLEAIVNQNFPKEEYELILVDNNSTDKTAEIAKSFGARVIKEEKQGNTFAISRGMKSAKGQLIALTDSDTRVSPDWLLAIKEIFKDEKIVAATGTADMDTTSKLFNWLSGDVYEGFVKFNFLIGKPHITGFNLVVRRSAFEKVGGVDEKFTMSSDIDLGLRLGKIGKVVFSSKLKAVTSFRRWEESPFKTFYSYFKSYIYVIWLRKPPPVHQNIVR